MTHRATNRNVLRRIEDIANSISKDYSNIHVIPRGAVTHIDQNLRGRTRFARRSGNFLPVLQANNQAALAADVTPPTDQIQVAPVLPGMLYPNAVISIGPGVELARIFDIDDVTGKIVTDQELNGTHVEGAGVNLYGIPIEVIGNPTKGSTTVQVRSEENIFIGDQIGIEATAGLLNSIALIRVTGATFLGTGIDGRFQYELDLAEGTNRSISNEEEILLSAQPGYQSLSNSATRVNGPFVIDFISGPFFEKTIIDEYLSIQLFNSVGDPVSGFETPVSSPKNTPVINLPINAESMLFWPVTQGKAGFSEGKFVATTDDNGRFVIHQEMVPAFPPGVEWQIPVTAFGTVLMTVRFYPNPARTFSLSAGNLQRVLVGMLPGDEPATRVEIALRSEQPNRSVEFSKWATNAPAVSSIQYNMTSTAFGASEWQGGSLLLKEYFFTLEDVSARYDFSAYDNGVLHF